MNQPTQYAELNAVLADFVGELQPILGDQLVAVYLQGSFALGDGDQDSDVDFTVIVQDEFDQAQIEQLNILHTAIYQQPSTWAHHLEGSYFPRDLIRYPDPAKQLIPYLDNTHYILQMSNHDNELVVRWLVRERGIALFGPPASDLIEPIDPEALRAEVRTTLQDWGAEVKSGSYNIANRWAQPFVVLSYCRMLQTLETATIESKPAAVRWAKHQLDPQWHELINQAWQERPNPSQKFRQPADPAAIQQTLKFVKYCVEKSRG